MSRSECNCGRCRMLRSFPGGVAAGGGRWGYEGALPRPKSLPPGMCFVLVDLDSRKGGGGGGDRAAAVETAEREIQRKRLDPPVQAALHELHNAQIATDMAISDLLDRLDGVLASEVPEASQSAPSRSHVSQLHGDVIAMCDRQHAMRATLLDAINRLTV